MPRGRSSVGRRRAVAVTQRYGNVHDRSLIQRVRVAFTFTQAQMGEVLGISQGAVSHIETMDRGLDHLSKVTLARLLQMKKAIALDVADDVNGMGCATGQTIVDRFAFLTHLIQCGKCMARAIRYAQNPS